LLRGSSRIVAMLVALNLVCKTWSQIRGWQTWRGLFHSVFERFY
jgi:hypothetical protein